MLLYNIVLGNQKLAQDPWKHIVDQHGNHFIAKEDIRQRIRIDEKVDPSTYPELGNLPMTWGASNMQCYNVLPGTKWFNNNRNMNPLLLENKFASEDNEQIVVYITVSNNYSIVRFNTPYKILQTYHKKDILQGCAVVLNSKDIVENGDIIRISVYDKKNNAYNEFNVHFMKEDHSKILVNRKNITNPKVLESMKSQIAKFNNRYLGFKIVTKPKDLLTVAYVTSDKFKDEVVHATRNIKNPLIITINPEQLENPANNANIIKNLQKEFEESRIRAITQCGVNLPLDVVRQLKLLYVFNYDMKNNVLSCRKSN